MSFRRMVQTNLDKHRNKLEENGMEQDTDSN